MYAGNYSANFTDRSLVDKAYVDGLHSTIWDDDGDTGIQVEEAADEDMIRFDIGNTSGTAHPNALVIDSDGEVGIGTASPGALLDVRGTAIFNEDGADSDFRIESDTDTEIFFVDASTNRVGIGTTTPTHKLQVDGQVRATSFANANGTNGSPAYRFNSDANTGMYLSAADTLAFTTGGSERMRISSGGIVGIGDTDPTNGGLVVANGVTIGSDSTGNLFDDATNGASSTTMYIGNATIDVTTPSDRRLKENIRETSLSVQDLMNIEMMDFNYNSTFTNDTETLYNGAIAQQVQEVFPQAVSTRSDGYLMIDYKKFIPLLMKSVQDQQLEIEALRNGEAFKAAAPENNDEEVNLENLNLDEESALSFEAVETALDQGILGDLLVSNLTVLDLARFRSEVVFNADTVGQATILAGETKVRIDFDDEYLYDPVVTITMMGLEDVRYAVENVSKTGFEIVISSDSLVDVNFGWHALAVADGKNYSSAGAVNMN